MTQEQDFSRQDVEAKVAERAAKDDAFRQALLSDPKAALGTELGITLPEGLDVRVHEETPTRLHLVIPRLQALESDDLDDAALENVAGGVPKPSVEGYTLNCHIAQC